MSDISLQKTVSIASYSASVTTAAGGALTVNDIALILGITLATFTFIINWLYQSSRNKRDVERHELEKKLLNLKIEQVGEE